MTTHRTSSRAAALVAASLLLLACGSSRSTDTAGTTTTTASTTTTVAGATSSTSTPTSTGDTAVWPFATGTLRFSDPVAAARSFAVDYLGFVNPVIGPFNQGDSRSGEVSVQAKATGPVTTVIVRQLAPDDAWWVLGAATPTLQLQAPSALDTISSPVTLSGESTAFEATVNVEIRQDGTVTPLAADIVMGGSNGTMGPFSKSLTFAAPTATGGAVVLKVLSAEDGNISEASVVRVHFG
jgi:hypothetical protein